MNKPLKIQNIIGSSGLSGLLAQARALSRLEHRLLTLLPEPLKPHCHVLAVRGRTLVLAADSPVWASRLRFHAPQLQRQLARCGALDKVRVRVRPPSADAAAPQSRRSLRPRNRAGNESLRQAARTVSDPELKSALLRLAGRTPGD